MISKFLQRNFIVFLLTLNLSTAAVFAEGYDGERGSIEGDIFGKQSNFYHAYLSIYEAYDDNIFNTREKEESDFITVVNPGIQVTIPGTGQPAEEIVADNAAIGGLVFGRFRQTSFRRFRAYAGYAPLLHYFADNEDENVFNHHAQGGLQLNLKGGLSFDAVDRYTENYDQKQVNTSPHDDRYRSNIFSFAADYLFSESFRLKVDYTNFRLEYANEKINGYRNRADNSATAYLFFKLWPKTALYLKYQYTDIEYDNDLDRNGDAQDATAGIKWSAGAKTELDIQAGYGNRNYNESIFEDGSSFVCQANLIYQVSSATRISLDAYRRNEESIDWIYERTTTTAASLKIWQRLTSKLNFDLNAACRYYDYSAGKTSLSRQSDRVDTYFLVTPSFTYAFRRWLSASLAYTHRQRNSDMDENAFTGNTMMIKITTSI